MPVPFLVSSKGYGIFVRTLEAGAFDVAATSPDVVRATFEGARATVALYEDEDPLRVVADYTRATSLPRLPPRWSFAPQQGRSAWRSGDEMLDDARRLRREGIPITTLWIDGPWQTSDNDGRIDEARFPNPAALLQTLASLGYRVIFSSAPSLDAVAVGAQPMNEAERLFVQARDRGMLVRDASGAPYVSPPRPLSADGPSFPLGALMDFSSVESLWFFRETLRGVIELGGRGFTLDAADALRAEVDGQRTGLRFSYDATERTQRGAYAFHYHNVYRAALARWARDDGVVVVRAANSGGQRDCDIVWPGDLDNDFRAGTDGQVGGLPAAVSALISLSESGFPSFASETGGARGGRPTREALLRWAEHTAMSPFMLLGGGASHNPWTDDAEASVVLRDLARLHLQLVPYFYAQGQRASRDGTPPVRSLALAFPDEPGARGDAFSYLLGPDLLAAPVVTPGATTRRVHIPRGTWVHWFTRERYAGPMEVEVPAPIGRPPLFVRAGAVVPMLAPEVETLVDAASADLVDAADRAAVRGAHIVPRGDVSALVDGAGVRVVASSPTRTELTFTPSGDVSVLRAQVDVGSRGVTSPRVRVRLREVDLPESDLALQGICGRCWHFDASQGIVTLTLQGELAVTITVEPSSP